MSYAQSPLKAPAKTEMVPLSPGPEKVKLQMDVVASLLNLSGNDDEEQQNDWTTSFAAPCNALRAAKRLTSADLSSPTLTLPGNIFECIFGRFPPGATVGTAFAEPASGPLMALAAAKIDEGAAYALSTAPLLSTLRAQAGELLLLTAVTGTAAAIGPARARCSLEKPPYAGAAAARSPASPDFASDNTDNTALAPHTACNVDALGFRLVSDGSAHSPLLPLDTDAADAAAALASVGGDAESGEEASDDPDWSEKPATGSASTGVAPKGRGRPRKRKPAAAGEGAMPSRRAGAGGAGLSCSHCSTTETPRWWKDNAPLGTLCNACGIWLKRHGYPRPVQFFVNPATVATAAAAPRAAGSRDSSRPAPALPERQALLQGSHGSDEFYLINGRPKRRRTAPANGAYGRGSGADGGGGSAEGSDAQCAAASPEDPPINFDAAGCRVFVVRRKLVKGVGQGGEASAVLVHFGWAPAARAAHEMFDRVSAYSDASVAVSAEEFELLSDCKATAQLALRPGVAAPGNWDALVRHFVEAL